MNKNDTEYGLYLLDRCFGIMLIILGLPSWGNPPILVVILTCLGLILAFPYKRVFKFILPRWASITLYLLGGFLLRIIVEL